MRLSNGRPLGVVVIAVWTGLLGLASLVLSIPGSLTHLPVGLLYLAGSYGMWRQTKRGASILIVAWAVGAVQSTIVRGNPLAFVGVILVSGYLYYRREEFQARRA